MSETPQTHPDLESLLGIERGEDAESEITLARVEDAAEPDAAPAEDEAAGDTGTVGLQDALQAQAVFRLLKDRHS